jgi:hypothetical protein
MVGKSAVCAAFLMFPAMAAAKSPMEAMFPGPDSCYARSYSPDHLVKHPAQRVTDMAIRPDFSTPDPFLPVLLTLDLRGVPGGSFEAFAACANEADHLYCAMEGDAGGFVISPAKGGAILIRVSSLGMTFENATGFATLDHASGDDRSFLLPPQICP